MLKLFKLLGPMKAQDLVVGRDFKLFRKDDTFYKKVKSLLVSRHPANPQNGL